MSKHDSQTTHPGDHNVDDENMPLFPDVVCVEETVHADDLVRENGRH